MILATYSAKLRDEYLVDIDELLQLYLSLSEEDRFMVDFQEMLFHVDEENCDQVLEEIDKLLSEKAYLYKWVIRSLMVEFVRVHLNDATYYKIVDYFIALNLSPKHGFVFSFNQFYDIHGTNEAYACLSRRCPYVGYSSLGTTMSPDSKFNSLRGMYNPKLVECVWRDDLETIKERELLATTTFTTPTEQIIMRGKYHCFLCSAAMFGAVKCFKYAWSHTDFEKLKQHEDMPAILFMAATIGRNLEIFGIIESKFARYIFKDADNKTEAICHIWGTAMVYHNWDVVRWIRNNWLFTAYDFVKWNDERDFIMDWMNDYLYFDRYLWHSNELFYIFNSKYSNVDVMLMDKLMRFEAFERKRREDIHYAIRNYYDRYHKQAKEKLKKLSKADVMNGGYKGTFISILNLIYRDVKEGSEGGK